MHFYPIILKNQHTHIRLIKLILKRTNLCNELDNLDKDVKGSIFRNHTFVTLGEKTADNTLQTASCGCVTLTFDTNHVHPMIKADSTCFLHLLFQVSYILKWDILDFRQPNLATFIK